jgi:hypothetical protein
MQAKKVIMASGAGGAEYWWTIINDSTDGLRMVGNEGNNPHTVLSDGSVVFCGYDTGSPGDPGKYGRVLKLNPDGSIAWESRIGNTIESGDRGYNLASITHDSSENIYVMGRYFYGDRPYALVELNSSTGAITDEEEFDTAGNFLVNMCGHLGVCNSAKGGLAAAGEIEDRGVDSRPSALVHDISDLSSKTSVETFTDSLSLGNDNGGWVSDGSIYTLARPWNSGNSRAQLQKLTIGSGGTSLTQSFGKQYYPNNYTHRSRAICSTSNDSTMVLYADFQGMSGSVGVRDHTLMLLNSGGNPTTISSFENGGNNSPDRTSKVRIDSNGNIYLFARISGTNNILKYNSSLQKQWHQQISYASPLNYLEIYGLEIDDNDNLVIAGMSRLSTETYLGSIIIKIPNDASLTGSYNGITISNVTSGWTYRDQMSVTMNTASVSFYNNTRSQTAQNHFTSASGLNTESASAYEVIS